MPAAPLPPNESERLAALRATGLLDSPRERWFDDLVARAARGLRVPTAMVTLVDQDRQWFKARIGMEPAQTPRAAAFCAHAILTPRPLVVSDARADPRFADNPMVTGAPGIRFYAGVPLRIGSGLALGTLCVIDYVPREIKPAELVELVRLGRSAAVKLAVRALTGAGPAPQRGPVRSETDASSMRPRSALHSETSV